MPKVPDRPPAGDDQLAFGDLGPRSRATDPPTSRQAAEQLDHRTVGARCRRYLLVIRQAGDDGATRDEVARAVGARGAEDRALSRRLTDLAQARLVEDSGRTRLSESARRQVVWVVTPAGRLEAARVASAETRRSA